MGQAMSQSELEDSVHGAFSDRLLILHGLFPSPYPRGTHVKCEVDAKTVSALTEWQDIDSELVIQVVKGSCICSSSREQSTEILEIENRKDHANADSGAESESTEGKDVFCNQGSESVQENVRCLDELTVSVTDSLSTHSELGEKKIIIGEYKQNITQIIPQGSNPCICNPGQKFPAEVLSLLCSLSSCTSLVDASFDAIHNAVNQSRTPEEKVIPTWSYNQASFVKDHLCVNKSVVNQDNLDFLLQRMKGKASYANVVPVLGAFQKNDLIFLVYPAAPFTLENILHFSPMVLDDEWNRRFLIYQLLSAVAHFHDSGIVHGDLKPSNILLTEQMWCWITGFHVNSFENLREEAADCLYSSMNSNPGGDKMAKELEPKTCSNDLQSALRLWCQGDLSNYDYLLILNKLAGRRWGDCKFHTVMPWVIDFSVRPEETSEHGWRDLTKSKWHLAKGDEQLDFTYATAEIPHHVSDECLSELAVCIYKARRLPLCILRKTVRSVYEPNEYPASLQRLYQWTPDECIPEFYSDASIFSSVHAGMPDLAIPIWAKDAEDFVSMHREALEGEHVSGYLHNWIDLTFGYKLSGEAAIGAKNVTLQAASPTLPRSQGRRQLFTLPHPKRQRATIYPASVSKYGKDNARVPTDKVLSTSVSCTTTLSAQTVKDNCSLANLEILEEVTFFCRNIRHLSPVYSLHNRSSAEESQNNDISRLSNTCCQGHLQKFPNVCNESIEESKERNIAEILAALELNATNEGTYQDFLLWQSKAMQKSTLIKGADCDIFALGCIIAELYSKRPLFDPISLRDFEEHGLKPAVFRQLPAHVQSLVELMTERNPERRISAAYALESPFFPPTMRAVHTFILFLYLIKDQKSRLQAVARLASHGAFMLMGSIAAKKCICICLSSLVLPKENIPVQECIAFLNAALLSLKAHDAKMLLIPVIQNFLQGERNHELKLALLHVSFVRKIYKCIGLNSYLQLVHPVVLIALRQSSETGFAVAVSNLLIETCEEIGVPITYYQTVGPLLQQFGRDVAISAIDTIVEIGRRLGECLVVKHLLPTLRAMISVCLSAISREKSGPARSWRMLVMKDAVAVLNRLLRFLPSTTVFFALVQEPHNVIENLLVHSAVDTTLRQHAAKALLLVCQCIGADAAAAYIVPRLQPLFAAILSYKLDSSKDYSESCGSISSCATLESISDQTMHSTDLVTRGLSDADSSNTFNSPAESETYLDLLHYLYSGLASLLGIERLRRRLNTWLITEQILLKVYGWKWETSSGACEGNGGKPAVENVSFEKPRAELSSTSLLFNEIGWSVPQPALNKGKLSDMEDNIKQRNPGSETGQNRGSGPWTWLPISEDYWDSTDFLNRPGLVFNAAKDERPWKVKAKVSYAWRAHSGPLKAVAVGDGEATIFTAGVGTKMRGLVKQWQLSTTQSVMEYTGHEEVVNDVCIVPWTQKVASCDGSIHLWDAQTGKCVAVFSESSKTGARSSSSVLVENNNMPNVGSVVTSGTSTSGEMLFTGIHGSHYTCMHLLETEQRLVAGTGSGHLRFFDLTTGQSLHLWRCDLDPSGCFLVSAITSAQKQSLMDGGCVLPSPWIAVGFGMGLCGLLDFRVGNFVASWRAHEGFITKLSAFDDHCLVSSSMDKTLCLWDLRRNGPVKLQTFYGHSYGVSNFEIWGSSLFSAGGNKIGISNISRHTAEVQESVNVKCHKLFSSDLSNLGLSSITATSVLPFSRFLVIGTDDGYLRVCK